MHGSGMRAALSVWVGGVLLFLFVPIFTIVIFAFDRSNVQSWPIKHYTLHWFSVAWHDQQVRDALTLSLKAGGAATLLALVLGSLAAFAVHRFKFFGREAISLLLVLPLALPGIVTGIALQSFFNYNKVNFSLTTIVIGHTHTQFDRRIDGHRIINAGSVGAAWETEPGAHWALIEDGARRDGLTGFHGPTLTGRSGGTPRPRFRSPSGPARPSSL